ncbi:MAG: GNAT family N-acetyltransferase [Acidimicrobiales bacterium]
MPVRVATIVMIETIETDRLLMRPFEAADLDVLVVLHEEESFGWYPLKRGMTPEETAGFLDRVLSTYARDELSFHALVDRTTGSVIGWAGLSVPTFLPEVLPAVEVGWRLAAGARGQGYATEAGAAAIAWGFASLGLAEILSIFEPDNVASGSVMDRLGFGPGFATVHPTAEVPLLVRTLTEEQWRAAG